MSRTSLRFPLRPFLSSLVVLAALTGVAHAQDAAQAEKLFNDAKAAMAKGSIAEACDLFQASEKLDSSGATLMNLGDCREKNRQYASAWEAFIAVERKVRGDDRFGKMAEIATARAAALEPRLSYLTINVPDEVRVEGLTVLRDGAPIAEGAWNRALPIDGGEHTITGSAPGHEAWSTKVTVAAENERKAVEVPKFKAIRNPTGKTVIINRDRPSILTKRRKIAIGVAGAGVAFVVAGAVMGLRSQRLDDQANTTCPATMCSLDDADRANELAGDARTMAIGANVGFGLGAVAIAGGAVLWFLSGPVAAPEKPRAATVTPTVAPGYAGLSAAVRF